MARVTYGESITEYAGSIGGVTFLRNASGPIAKLRSLPPVNPSPNQSKYQTRMAMLVAHWPTLTQTNKNLWDALALAHNHTTPWGETKTLSGYQWFLSVNLVRLLYLESIREFPAEWYVPPPPNQFTIQIHPTYIRAAWDPAYDAPYDLLAYCSLPLRQSSIKLRRSLFLIKVYPTAPSMSYWDLTSEIESLFNVSWATFYASCDCSIIIRIKHCYFTRGYSSAFTSAIIKIA